jgi:hypothetical protein
MVEASPKADIQPIFSERYFSEYPYLAKAALKEYWKQQASITRWHIEEFGVSGSDLVVFAKKIPEMIEFDASVQPGIFGGLDYKTEYYDGLTNALSEHLAGRVDEAFQNKTEILCKRYFLEIKRQYIFEYSPEERVAEVCEANGGIPGFTEHEKRLLIQY